MNRKYFKITALVSISLCFFIFFADELYSSIVVGMMPTFYFAWLLYFSVNRIKMYFFNDFYGGGFCFYFAISLIFYIFTFFAIYSLYEEIDAKVLARFANGDYCGGVIVCTDSGRMVVQGIASRTYRMSIKGECVKIASSSYSYKKINFQSEACKKE